MNSITDTIAGETEKAYRKIINSWAMYDWANSAFVTTIMATVLPVYYSSVAGVDLPGNLATVYWGYTTSIALLITALLAPILGAIADFSGMKKRFLMAFAAMGVLFSALLYFVTTGDWLMASLFFIFGNIAFAAADLFYNSLLPHVARPEDIDEVSTRGYAFGYLGGGLLLAINVLMIQFMADKTLAARLSFVSVAVWWGIFTLPLVFNIKEPPATREESESINPVLAGFRRVWRTFNQIRHYKQLFLFLVAFWAYNDGIGTIIKMATIYGAEIGIGQTDLIGALLMTQFVGIPFAFGFGRLAKRIGAKSSIYLGLTVYTLISMAGYFMSVAWHFWLLAFMVGTVQGGSQALSRSLFGAMSPKAKMAEFFGFYEMSSRTAGIIGPFLFAVIGQMAGSSRLSIVALVVFFIMGGFLLSRVDIQEGIRVAREENAGSDLGKDKGRF
ncbi:MAG: MFS transporter [Anaerolineae bacterium]|nr:MFS transporter [Anaerolineae bacterium]